MQIRHAFVHYGFMNLGLLNFLFLKRWVRGGALLLAFTLCSVAQAAGPVLDRIVEQGVLRVAMSGDQQPFNFVYGKQQSVIGFDVDLAGELAKSMNVDLDIVTIPFNDLMAAVESGRVDMVVSGMSITAARTRNVSFIGPYVLSGKSLLARSGALDKLSSPGDFNVPGLKLVALKGSTSESLVRQELPDTSLRPVPSYDEGIRLLMSGEVDGMVADMPILAYTKNRYRDAGLQLVTPPLSIEPMGIVIASEDPQLENLLRNYMAVYEQTGLLLNLYRKWFELGSGKLYAP